MAKILCLKVISVLLEGMEVEFNVLNFEGESIYKCLFKNTDIKDFVNSYNTFGFIVNTSKGEYVVSENSKLSVEDAIGIWKQIESKLPLAKEIFRNNIEDILS